MLRPVLRVLGVALVFAGLIYALGPIVGPAQDFFAEPPFVANSVVKVVLLGLVCLYAAGDLEHRFALVWLVVAAHAVSLVAMVVALAFGETGAVVDLWLGDPTIEEVLWGAIALDGVITIVLAGCALAFRGERKRGPAEPLTQADRRFRALMIVLGVLFAVAAVAYEAGALIEDSQEFFVQLPFVTNSVVKVSALAMLCLYVARDVSRNLALAGPIVAVHFISPVVQFAYLLFDDTDYSRPLFDWNPEMTDVLWGAIALDGAIGVLLLLAYRAAWQSHRPLKFLSPASFRSLVAVADVVVEGEPETIPAQDVAVNVDHYLRHVRARRSWVYRASLLGLQFGPLLTARPPLSECDRATRRAFLKHSFWHPPPFPPMLRDGTRAAVRVGQQLSFAGYYNDPATWPSIGYVPFESRDRFPALDLTPPGDHPLDVELAHELDTDTLEADVCIVGSGAGGSILAYELAKAGRDVLMLERGHYVQPKDFTDNEVEMIGALYADGVMQQTEDFRFTVLQGSCVGGSTTVNNAVCFPPPELVLETWNEVHDAGLDLDGLRASVEAVEAFLDVHTQNEAVLNPSGDLYMAGAAGKPLEAAIVRANIRDCPGSGYCNLGCKWGRKLSMLQLTLPRAQKLPGKVRIVADCEVEQVRTLSGSPRRVASLGARAGKRRLKIDANDYVLAAGAVGSSYLLLRSGAARGLPVGRHLSFNMGAPLTAEVEEKIDAYDGLQISHYGIPHSNGYVFETWFNPPVAQALNMPGWFERHFANMSRYDHMMAAGVLVGTEASARVGKALLGGPAVHYTPSRRDLGTLARGLKLLAEIMFAAGGRRVMLNTARGDAEITEASQSHLIHDWVMEPGAMTLGTGHPQGGNAISRDRRRGVVDENFRVHGYEHLYVCDASVFPSSLTVNPQLTVMGLAHYAASRIA